jgi:hypothetical protein
MSARDRENGISWAEYCSQLGWSRLAHLVEHYLRRAAGQPNLDHRSARSQEGRANLVQASESGTGDEFGDSAGGRYKEPCQDVIRASSE